MLMSTWIGVDLGGTNLRAAITDEKGQLLHVAKADTLSHLGPLAVLARVADAVKSLPGWESAKGLGMGIPGGVMRDGQTPVLATNLKDFDGFPVRDYLSRLLCKPVAVENDANMACLAEALLGAGQGLSTVVYVTVSTGIGGGICINGRLLKGLHGCAGEFGSMSCDPGRTALDGLPQGAIESEASGDSLVRKAEAALHLTFAHAGEVYDLAAAGHMGAAAIMDQAAHDLAVTLANIACVLDPDVFILGGGCLKSADVLLPRLIAAYKAFAHPVFRDIPIRKAALEEPGLTGAAMYARENV